VQFSSFSFGPKYCDLSSPTPKLLNFVSHPPLLDFWFFLLIYLFTFLFSNFIFICFCFYFYLFMFIFSFLVLTHPIYVFHQSHLTALECILLSCCRFNLNTPMLLNAVSLPHPHPHSGSTLLVFITLTDKQLPPSSSPLYTLVQLAGFLFFLDF
jgi:hypothetical protein